MSITIADFHVHTLFSGDSPLSPRVCVSLLANHGYNAIALVDHDSPKGAVFAKKHLPKRILQKITVIAGQEVKTEKGELIILGCEKTLRGNFEKIVEFCKEENYLCILPHPLDFFRKNSACRKGFVDYAMKHVDAVECINARSLMFFNLFAKSLAKKLKKPCVAGSDAHMLNELERVKNVLFCKNKEEEIFETIRKGKVKVFVKPYFSTLQRTKSLLWKLLFKRYEKVKGIESVNTAVETMRVE